MKDKTVPVLPIFLSLMIFAMLPLSAVAGGWTGPLTVEQVFTEGNTDVIVIYTSGGVVNTPSCIANSWIFVGDNSERRNRGYATAMAALSSGKTISLWYSDTCQAWSFHGATTIRLHK